MEMLDDYYYLMVSGDVVGYNKSVFFYHSFSNMHSDLLHSFENVPFHYWFAIHKYCTV